MSSWSTGSTRAWRELRARVLSLNAQPPPDGNGGRCRLHIDGTTSCPRHRTLCARVCTTTATHVHHTRGRAVTGDDPRWLVAACAACNLHVGEPPVDPPGRGTTHW